MDRGAWRATVHGVLKSQTHLSDSAQHIDSRRLGCLSGIHCPFFLGGRKGKRREGKIQKQDPSFKIIQSIIFKPVALTQ